MAEAVLPGAAKGNPAVDVAPEGIGAEIIAKNKKFDDEKAVYDKLGPDTKTTAAIIAMYTSGFDLYSYTMANVSTQPKEAIDAAQENYVKLLNELADECIRQTKEAGAKHEPKADAETKKLCEYFMETLDKTADDIKTTKEIKGKIEEIQSFINNLESLETAVPPKESSDVTDAQLAEAMNTLDALYANPDVKNALASAVARAKTFVQPKKIEGAAAAGGTQRVGTKKRKRRKRRGKGTGKNKPLSEVNVVL
jgi:hypothetical protein